MPGYNHAEVQEYWRYVWDREAVYELSDSAEDPTYVLGMFPYTSGSLHMGHVRNYTITDAYARYRRLQGDDVLHPMGWDAFGLPAENAAYERFTDPESWTRSCIERMRSEMEAMGFGYDWSREITTCDPEYYRWNQWLFKRFDDAGLVEYEAAAVNWCPDCETVLADAQVEERDREAVCWRCGTPVTHRELDQWFFTITDYAEELHSGLDELDGWPDNVKEIQRNWIGRREGATVAFDVEGYGPVEVFTTRLDTIFGATYLAVSPAHDLVESAAETDPAIADITEMNPRLGHEGSVTEGVETDFTAIHPITGETLPVYVAAYVLEDVGTGAVMGVPAHNERDHAFARAHDLPIREGVTPAAGGESPVPAEPFTDDGIVIDGTDWGGVPSATARDRLVAELDSARPETTYRLRDWLISRQRYWGTPIPIIHCEDCGPVHVPDEELPVTLPEYVQTTGNPLEAVPDFVETDCPECGEPARRETDTMDTFVDSSWYFLRFLTPDLATAPFDSDLVDDWLPIDVYVGGEEHAILHLLYIRFFMRALADIGLIDRREPVERLVNQGTVLYEGEKMSTTRGNVVAPHEYGAETTRLFVLSAAHPERDFEWTAKDVSEAYEFQQTVHGMVDDFVSGAPTRTDRRRQDRYLDREVDRTIAAVTADYDRFRFHNAIAEIQQLARLLRRYRSYEPPHEAVYERGLRTLALLLAPIAPFLGEELWNMLRGGGLAATADWPAPTHETDSYRIERELVRRTLADVRDILDVVDIQDPESIELVVAPEWKHRAYDIARAAPRGTAVVGRIVDDPALQDVGDGLRDFAAELEERQDHLEPIVDGDRELEILRDAAWLFADEFGTELVIRRGETGEPLAESAKPNKPAIHIQ